MKNKILYFLGLITICISLNAKDYPISQIEQKLNQAENDFAIAKKMFNPWYGGPLITGSGNVYDPGYVNINPTVQVTDYYAAFDNSRKSIPIPDIMEVNPSVVVGVGVVKRVELDVQLAWDFQEQSNVSFFGWQDSWVKLSLGLVKEKPYVPAMKFSVKEIFPTGRYKNLNPIKAGVEGLGDGAYKTEFAFNISKVAWWIITHPMDFRFAFIYGIADHRIKVTNFNSYGGGFGTNGKVNYHSYWKVNFGYEFSVTQKIVWAIDLVYEYFGKRAFKGINGFNEDGTIAIVGAPSGDKLSLAPAVEYNFTPDIALVGGLWFTVWGRNKLNFIAGIINFSYGF